MNYQYTEQEIEYLREGGKRLSWMLKQLGAFLEEGVTIHEIEMKTRHLIDRVDATSATIGYVMDKATPFPSAVCVSVNNEVVHGIAHNNQRVLKNGDIVSLDVVIVYKGMYVDICRSWGVGAVSTQDQELLRVARKTTDLAVETALAGNTVDDIGTIAQEYAESYNMTTARELGGHGVGKKIHMPPFIPNFAGSGFKDKIVSGMVLAVEPIVCVGDWRVEMANDGWLFTTRDGSKSAQFEETVLITENGNEILTSDEHDAEY